MNLGTCTSLSQALAWHNSPRAGAPITRDCCAVHTGFPATNSVELDSVGWGRDSWPQDFIAAMGGERLSTEVPKLTSMLLNETSNNGNYSGTLVLRINSFSLFLLDFTCSEFTFMCVWLALSLEDKSQLGTASYRREGAPVISQGP